MKRSAVGTGELLRVVGVDDWAWKKLHHYGTILVDLVRKKTVDLLPGRSADEVANWLQKHPGVEIVSRDRHGLYADGAAHGAPQARQVADRFHLILNLRQAVEQELSRQRQALVWPLAFFPVLSVPAPVPALPPPACVTAAAVSPSASEPPPVSPVVQQRRQIAAERRAAKRGLFAEVRRLSLAGRRASQIVRDTGVKRRRVDQWIRQAERRSATKWNHGPTLPLISGNTWHNDGARAATLDARSSKRSAAVVIPVASLDWLASSRSDDRHDASAPQTL